MGGRFAAQVSDLKRRRLHAVRKLVSGNAGIEIGTAEPCLAMFKVERANQVERIPLPIGQFGRRTQIEHGRAHITQARRLKGGGKKALGVICRATERAGVEQRPIAGQVVRFASQAIRYPGAEARLAGPYVSGVQLVLAGA